jgi:hypothetical protein
MRMERQPREGEILPNERARLLKPYAVINVELYDNAHITLWIRGTPFLGHAGALAWAAGDSRCAAQLSDNPFVGSFLQIRR